MCRTLSCALRGGYSTCEEFKKQLGCEHGTSHDKEYTVEFVECLASCGTAPVVMVDDTLHVNVDEARARAISETLKAEAAARPRG